MESDGPKGFAPGREFQIVELMDDDGKTPAAMFSDGGVAINAGVYNGEPVIMAISPAKMHQLVEKWLMLQTYQKEFANVSLSA